MGGLAQIRGATEILEGLRVLLSGRRSEDADGTLEGVSGRSEADAVVLLEGSLGGALAAFRDPGEEADEALETSMPMAM